MPSPRTQRTEQKMAQKSIFSTQMAQKSIFSTQMSGVFNGEHSTQSSDLLWKYNQAKHFKHCTLHSLGLRGLFGLVWNRIVRVSDMVSVSSIGDTGLSLSLWSSYAIDLKIGTQVVTPPNCLMSQRQCKNWLAPWQHTLDAVSISASVR